MIVVRLKGGTGNQMFQYAYGRALSLKKGETLGLDKNYLGSFATPREYTLDVFNIKAQLAKSYQIFFSMLTLRYFDGYWQSENYFKEFENEIRKDFKLKNSPAQNILDLAKEISSSDSLCLHVRRGDYVGNAYHETVDRKYYEQGLKYISERTAISRIYVFSDDIEWCKENMKFDYPMTFVGDEYSGEKGEGHLYLMSACKNFLIPNSSFSWWAAWLSESKNKIVVAPKKWFNDESVNTDDITPKEWIRI
jgi:hypothetical protein